MPSGGHATHSRSVVLVGCTYLLAAFLAGWASTASAALIQYTWANTAGGTYDWNNAANWGGATFPNLGGASGHKANLSKNITGDMTVNLGQSITVGAITIEDSGGGTDSVFTLQENGGSFIFDFGASAFKLIGILGTTTSTTGHLLATDIQLKSNLSAEVTGLMTVSGGIGEIGGSKTLTKTGSGLLYLTGSNSYSGGTIIDAGTLNIASDAALGTAPDVTTTNITFTGGTLQTNANLTISPSRSILLGAGGGTIDTQANEVSYSGAVTGTTALTKAGSGLLALNVSSINSGGAVIKGGVFRPAMLSGGALKFNDTSAVADANAVYEGSGTFSRALGTGSGDVSWTANSSGGFSAYGGSLLVDLATANTRDTIAWSAGNFLDTNYALLFGSTYSDNIVEWYDHIDLDTGSATVSRTIKVVDNPNTTADRAKITGDLKNTGTGTASLVKMGDGVLELAGSNAYKGTTTVSEGTLLVTGSLDSRTSAVTVNSGATLGGTGSILRPVVVNGGGHVSPGSSTGTLTLAGLQLVSGAAYDFQIDGALSDRIEITGAGASFQLAANGVFDINVDFLPSGATLAEYTLFHWTGDDPLFAGTTWNVSGAPGAAVSFRPADNLIVLAVPEMGTLSLLLSGLAFMAWMVGRCRRREDLLRD